MERIPLQALLVTYADGGAQAAIGLPDGRILMDGYKTYSSAAALLHFNPGAKVERVPDADDTINHVTDLSEERA